MPDSPSTTHPDPTPFHVHGGYGAQRPGVMARLHALFPQMHNVPDSDPEPQTALPKARKKPKPPPKFLKVRILTWNMHESLPKGDLEELLGKVEPTPAVYPPSNNLPEFSADENHPYHIVVVAGQECPTVSGLPRGLGAPEFRLRDKERDKSKDKEDPEKADKPKERPRSFLQVLEPDKPERDPHHAEEKDRDRPRSLHRLHLHRDHHRPDHISASSSVSAGSPHDHSNHQPYGWSSMLEEWYTNGVISSSPPNPNDPTLNEQQHPRPLLLNVPIGDESLDHEDVHVISPKAQSTGDLTSRIQSLANEKGPYELLVKERMMGLYLAVFVHRDVKNLVKGTSKSAVTTGLIGGRLGNKGGVGVSVNLNGTTLLFINAHLAAHEGKMHHRLANLAKIKSELAVDDFLPTGDPRLMAEDLTDRFDFTFICGDLNFRLDITRLHADWLISRREFEQALAFDQLRKVMAEGKAFIGFSEAPIHFPPTFKYDVQRRRGVNMSMNVGVGKGVGMRHAISLKRISKSGGNVSGGGVSGGGYGGGGGEFQHGHVKVLTEISEKEKEMGRDSDQERELAVNQEQEIKDESEKGEERGRPTEREGPAIEIDEGDTDEGDGEGEGEEGEAASVASSMWTSLTSKYTGDGSEHINDSFPEEEYFSYHNTPSHTPSHPQRHHHHHHHSNSNSDVNMNSSADVDATTTNTRANAHIGGSSGSGKLMHKVWAAAAAHKAKAKFVSLLASTPNSPAGKFSKFRRKSEGVGVGVSGGAGVGGGGGGSMYDYGEREFSVSVSTPSSAAVSPNAHSIAFSTPNLSSATGSTPNILQTPGGISRIGGTGSSSVDADDRFLKPSGSVASYVDGASKVSANANSAVVRTSSPTPTKPRKSDEESEVEEDVKGVYDSSAKRRVPSWCDRILWKSTIVPEPESEEEEDEPPPLPPPVPPRTRMGHFFHAFRPLSSRGRRDSQFSVSSITSPEASDAEDDHRPPATVPANRTRYSPQIRSPHQHQPHLAPQRKLSYSKSIDHLPMPTSDNPALIRTSTQSPSPLHESSSSNSNKSISRQLSIRKVSMPSLSAHASSVSTIPTIPSPDISHTQPRNLHTPMSDTTTLIPSLSSPSNSHHQDSLSLHSPELLLPPPLPPKDRDPYTLNSTTTTTTSPPLSSIWRSFNFFPFLSHSHTSSPNLRDRDKERDERGTITGQEAEQAQTKPVPKRGEVVCLGYHTLDDRAMQKLAGRSDHRPVIGSYALYI